MKKLIIIVGFIFLFGLSASAQKVEVDQGFIDDATKAFKEVVALRSAVEAQKLEIEARKSLDAINAQIIEKQTARFNDAEKEIALLKKKAQRKVSILFGLIKITY